MKTIYDGKVLQEIHRKLACGRLLDDSEITELAEKFHFASGV